MKILEDSPNRLRMTIGFPRFNGSVIDLDRTTGRARIERTNLFFKAKPIEVALGEIETVKLRKAGKGTSFPVVVLTSGKSYSLASATNEANEAVPKLQAFLAGA